MRKILLFRIAVSYIPVKVPKGPEMRCNSSWIINSGGFKGSFRSIIFLPSLCFCGCLLSLDEIKPSF